MLTSGLQAIAFTNSLHSMRDAHQSREFRCGARMHIDFLQAGGFLRRVSDASNAFDQISGPVPIAGHNDCQTVDSIVALIPRIDRFVGCECTHCHFPYEIVNQHYKPFNRRLSERITEAVQCQVSSSKWLGSALSAESERA